MGDEPLLVMHIVVTSFWDARRKASTISTDEPEWDIPMATSPFLRWEAAIAWRWLSQYAVASKPARINLCCASIAIDAEFPRPNIAIRFAAMITFAAFFNSFGESTFLVVSKACIMSFMRFVYMVIQSSVFSILTFSGVKDATSCAIAILSAW